MARGAVFGLTSSRRGRGGNGNFRGNFRGNWRKNNRGGGRSGKNSDPNAPPVVRGDDGSQIQERFENTKVNDEVDEKLGFARLSEGPRQEGWLVNMHTTLVKDPEWPGGRSAVDYYFIKDDGGMFKCTLQYDPYFVIACKSGTETGVEEFLMKKYEGMICRISREKKEDLKMPNHLLGHRKLYLQLNFRNISDLLTVRRELLPLALANGKKLDAVDAYAEVVNAEAALRIQVDGEETKAWGADGDDATGKNYKDKDPRENIIDIREYDVPYYLRVAIDNDIRVGLWYAVTFVAGQPLFTPMPERVKRPDPVVMAFDIETTKAPLKFPDHNIDQVMMISYMIDGQGYLITNREIVSEDIEDFEYTPKEGYEGPFTIFNENDEASTIGRFFEHIKQVKPTVMATFNGDFFDFPFLRARAEVHGIDMFLEIGFAKDSEDEYKSRTCAHLDCFRWVKRDSYLPQGSQGLKAVTTAKLGYNPIELDPELMTPYALEQPQILAQYSVSDAVATYYLYMKYVHPFIFSLCNIIPLNPDEVLRKGTGTLCETLLMVEAYRGAIIMPNRHEDPFGNMFEGHLLASETYVGGHVEALEAGVFRSDIPTHFKIVPEAVQQLIDQLDAALKFCIVEESKMSLDNVTNYDEVKGQIQRALEEMRDHPIRLDEPLIYHLDVAAMYPNIMLSNRLQPDSVVDESVCAVCDYNTPDKTCDRRMTWAWRGEFFPAHRDEYNMVRHALNQETFPPKRPGDDRRRFMDLTEAEQTALLHKRLGDYSRKVYKKTKDTKVVYRESIICQRENPFYVDTVRRFRDRRYEYKGLHKTWKKNLDSLLSENASMAQLDEAKKLIVVYDSLQLAHKCILNSFYGYVMRKGARWHSMEMAGITCLTGATIIQMARQLVEQIGRPLELDTDGIWCMLPGIFPENFSFKVIQGKPVSFSYPCTMLNHLVYDQFTNHQYHDYDKHTGRYVVHSENSIFFELDGPYKAMILPSSKEEDKLLKKRYAVFNPDGSLAELKGFEVKRRGELQLIKIFQTQIFEKYLLGTTTEECYKAVAEVADRWLDILFTKGESLTNDELVELIAENRSMSKTLAEYGSQKSTSISTARRLAEFLGDQMVKDKGLACKFIISAKPIGAPVTERAVPVAIFSAEEKVKRVYLRKWLKDNSLANFELRSILDWNYYIERLGSVVQKLITIPAAMQKVSNPVPRIRHPDWLHKRVAALEDKFQQHKVTDFFKKVDPALKTVSIPADMEDFGTQRIPKPALSVSKKDEQEPKASKKPLPNPSVNYSAWLKAMRLRWKERREANLDASTAQIVPAMFRGVKVRSSRSWDVVQVRPGRGPGRFILWLSVDAELVPVTLRVPREFYINLKLPPKEGTFDDRYTHEKLIRTLPRNRPCLNLYKITTSEELYVKEESHFINLVNNPNVDGAYELKVPLAVRTLLKIGSSCSLVNPGEVTLNRARDIGLDLKQLERSNARGKSNYLNDGEGFKYLFLYHAISSNGSIHVFAVFNPMGGVHLHIVDPATRRQPLVRLQELYQDFMKQVGDVPSLIKYPAQLDFTTSYHVNDEAALKVISRELTALENRSYILLLSSSKNLEYFEDNMPKLSKFPVFAMPHNRSAHILDALPWQMDVAKKMLTRYLCVGQWLRVTLDQAVYYDVPIGHIEGDYPLFMADIEFCRRLQKQDILLWWSPNERPDWGGMEDDFQPTEELRSPEFHAPGCYSNVCLSMKMKNLAIDAILQSAVVNELEGSGGTTTFDSTSHTLEDYSQGLPQTTLTLGDSVISPQIFSIVKAMVKAWLLDKARATESPSPPDVAVEHFWRWISSNSAHMFDPNLQRFIHGLMLKTFIQLRAEFKRLGSSVVYADFNQILLVTSKPPGTAFAYAAYLTSAVNSHELFKHIFFEMENYYDFLLYMDNFNCGALYQDHPGQVNPNAKTILKMDWSIQRFLPPALHRHFTEAVKYFVLEMSKIKHKAFENGRTPMRVLDNLSQDYGTQIDEVKQKEVESCRTFISQRLTRKMLRLVGQIMDDYRRSLMSADDDEEPEMDFAFPILPGSHLSMSNPPLEFIKSICAVFGLAKDFSTEIGIVKRNLLDLIGVREFAEEAIFKNPCEPLKLPMVICQHCSAIRDLDFCRDATLFPSSVRAVKKWCCLECGCDYDRVGIEFALISLVLRMETAFVPQDLKCGKCKQLRSDNLSRRCKCSGNYQLTLNPAESRRKLRTLVNIATVHNLQRLKETAQVMLENW